MDPMSRFLEAKPIRIEFSHEVAKPQRKFVFLGGLVALCEKKFILFSIWLKNRTRLGENDNSISIS